MKRYTLMFLIAILLIANYTLLISYHSIDLSVNAIILRSDYENLIDYSPFGVKRTVKEIYLFGLLGLIVSLLMYNFVFLLLISLMVYS